MDIDKQIDIHATMYALHSIAASIGYDYLRDDMEKHGLEDEDVWDIFWREYRYFHSK